MNRSFLPAILFITCALAFLLLWLWQSALRGNQSRQAAVSLRSSAAPGLSIFEKYAKQTSSASITGKAGAILSTEEVPFDLLLVSSPRGYFSKREAKILKEVLEQRPFDILLTFYDQKTYEPINRLLTDIGLELPALRENPDFTNGESRSVFAPISVGGVQADNRYSFYSNSIFDVPSCQVPTDFDCNVVEFAQGAGTITVIASLSPLANGLIWRNDNESFARHLLDSYQAIGVDEYRNFFGDVGFTDILSRPSVFLPLLLLISAALFSFVFSSPDEVRSALDEGELASAHSMSAGLLHGLLAQGSGFADGLNFQKRCIERQFPQYADSVRTAVSTATTDLEQARVLLELHRMFVKQRGR
jgi:hypothetical protein